MSIKVMDWQPWLDEGLAHSYPGGRELAMPMIREAWQGVVRARASYLRNDFVDADLELRGAMTIAGESLVYHAGLRPAGPTSFEFARIVCTHAFGKSLAGRIFDTARMLREMLPLEPDLPEDKARAVRRSVAASSELVALVEGHVYTWRPTAADLRRRHL